MKPTGIIHFVYSLTAASPPTALFPQFPSERVHWAAYCFACKFYVRNYPILPQ